MRLLVLAVMSLSFAGTTLGQRHYDQYWSLGGFGNVLFPGTGHAPIAPPGGFPGHFFSREPAPRRPVNDPQPLPIVILPSPLYDGGYSEDRSKIYASADEDQTHSLMNPNSPPPVIVNQNFAPLQENPRTGDYIPQDDTYRHANTQGNAPNTPAVNDGRPTIYLIAFKDHSVVRALGYWMEAGTLHYVSADYGFNQASMGRIDLELSQRLNDERGIAFRFPAQK